MCFPAILLGVSLSYIGNYIVMGILSNKIQISFDRRMPTVNILLVILIGFGMIFLSYLFPLIKVLFFLKDFFFCIYQ
jgi:multisubunit Na+/H+ antiporter MnhB subunit